MFFLIRMAFWFSLVLLALPLGPSGTNGASVSPIQAFFAAQQAVDDMSGICERKPDVCEIGKAAMQTIGVRVRDARRKRRTHRPSRRADRLRDRSSQSRRAHRRRRDRQRDPFELGRSAGD
jgi:hypothetical protein